MFSILSASKQLVLGFCMHISLPRLFLNVVMSDCQNEKATFINPRQRLACVRQGNGFADGGLHLRESSLQRRTHELALPRRPRNPPAAQRQHWLRVSQRVKGAVAWR